MSDIIICNKCNDWGCMKGSKIVPTRTGTAVESWTEVCPYCMPTNKYGNLQEKLSIAPKLLTHQSKQDLDSKE